MQKIVIKMILLSDTIFGNGCSIPGAEDVAVLCDADGFPYFRGDTFKGIFREELERYLELKEENIENKINSLLGLSGNDESSEQIIFSDFTINYDVKQKILEEIGENHSTSITEILTNVRMFTKISENGTALKGSLRSARCVNQGISFYSQLICPQNDVKLIENVLGMIKWIGSMRNRGFGKVKITVLKGGSHEQ